MRSVPTSAVVCVVLTAALACVLLLGACRSGEVTSSCCVVVAGAVAFLVSLRGVRASRHATLSLGFVAVFWTLIHLGPQAAVVVAALSGLAAVLLPTKERPLASIVGIQAVATLTVTASAAGFVYTLAGGLPGSIDLWGMALPGAAAAMTYHLVNCALVSVMSGLASTSGVWRIFRTHFAVAGPSYYAGGGLAVLAHLTWMIAGAWPLVAAIPVLYSLHLTLKSLRPSPVAEQA